MNTKITFDANSEEVSAVRTTEEEIAAIELTLDELASVAGGHRGKNEYEGQHR